MSKIRIRGNARFFMMLARDIRRRWMQYGENRKTIDDSECLKCGATTDIQVDHIKAVGAYPRRPEELSDYVYKMLYGACQPLCRKCNIKKRNEEKKK